MNSESRILWADLHNHNEIGYGRGSLERSYRIAGNTLDVYALTVHGHWPDPPANDPALARYHIEALGKISAAFPEVVRGVHPSMDVTPAPMQPYDTYVFKARQWNGHTVWASPFLFETGA